MSDYRVRVLSAAFQAFLFGAITFYGVKWIMDALDPAKKSRLANQKQVEQLLKRIGVVGVKLSEYELAIAEDLVDPLSLPVEWTQIGGLRETIEEVKETVILPFKQRDIFIGSALLSPPKGVLLYGPPGCGKTMIAKATAKEAGCRFLNLQVSSLTDKWYGESQKLAAAVFSLAVKLQPCIVFIDEIDSFLRAREKNDHEATAMMKAQFMSLWDGLLTDRNCQVIVMGATNRPHDVDKAILRRMPASFHVGLPDEKQREDILRIILAEENVDSEVFLNLYELAGITNGFSGSDLREVCRTAAMSCVRDYLREQSNESNSSETSITSCESLRPITMDDLSNAAKRYSNSVSLKA